MNRTRIARLSAGLLFLLFSWIAYTQNQGQQAPRLTINKVTGDLYNIEGDGGNVAVLVTGEGVILVDDKFDRDHDAIVSNIKTVTNQPVKYVLSTHSHSDHSGGNAKFLSTAEAISTANDRTNILEHKQSNAPADVAPARLVFTQETAGSLVATGAPRQYYVSRHPNAHPHTYFSPPRNLL